MKIAVIIPAAGFSRRYADGLEVPRSKLDEDLGGRPVLQRTIEMFTNYTGDADVGPIVVAGPHDPAAFAEFKHRHADKLGLLGCILCQGGKTHRWETVKAALAHVPGEATHIAVHDAARPCTPMELLDRVFNAAAKHEAVVPAIDVGDTLKRVSADATEDKDVDPLDAILGDAGKSRAKLRSIEATVDRANLVAVQTPQVFQAALLRRAYAQPDPASTDDAQAVEQLWTAEKSGKRVMVVEGDPRNIKITRPLDLHLARSILGVKAPEGRPVHKRF